MPTKHPVRVYTDYIAQYEERPGGVNNVIKAARSLAVAIRELGDHATDDQRQLLWELQMTVAERVTLNTPGSLLQTILVKNGDILKIKYSVSLESGVKEVISGGMTRSRCTNRGMKHRLYTSQIRSAMDNGWELLSTDQGQFVN